MKVAGCLCYKRSDVRSRFVRSYTFWLGVLVPVFLLWVWVSSAYLRMEVSLPGPRGTRIDNRDGYIRMVSWRDPDALKWEMPGFGSIREDGHLFPGFAWRWQWEREFVDIQISHWLILDLYLVGFWGWWYGHRRRQREGDFTLPEA